MCCVPDMHHKWLFHRIRPLKADQNTVQPEKTMIIHGAGERNMASRVRRASGVHPSSDAGGHVFGGHVIALGLMKFNFTSVFTITTTARQSFKLKFNFTHPGFIIIACSSYKVSIPLLHERSGTSGTCTTDALAQLEERDGPKGWIFLA